MDYPIFHFIMSTLSITFTLTMIGVFVCEWIRLLITELF